MASTVMILASILCLFVARNTFAIGMRFPVNYRESYESTVNQLEYSRRKAAHLLRLTATNGINSKPRPAPLDVSVVENSKYVVTVRLGTPSSPLTLGFDTSSDSCWVNCSRGRFDPAKSSSFRRLPCTSSVCKSFPYATNCDAGGHCTFKMYTARGGRFDSWNLTATTEYVSQDILIGQSDAILGFVFVCTGFTGSLSLSRGLFSLVSQTSKTYGNIFSYCLPRSPKSTGFLALGEPANKSFIYYTPMLETTRGAYTLSLVGIGVSGELLPIKPSIFSSVPNFIDSGSEITYLPREAYRVLKKAFISHMSEYPPTRAHGAFDACFNFMGKKYVNLPVVTLVFDGEAAIDLDHERMIFIPREYPHVGCLAFAEEEGLVMIGTMQQASFEVVYDIGRQRIGFRANAC